MLFTSAQIRSRRLESRISRHFDRPSCFCCSGKEHRLQPQEYHMQRMHTCLMSSWSELAQQSWSWSFSWSSLWACLKKRQESQQDYWVIHRWHLPPPARHLELSQLLGQQYLELVAKPLKFHLGSIFAFVRLYLKHLWQYQQLSFLLHWGSPLSQLSYPHRVVQAHQSISKPHWHRIPSSLQNDLQHCQCRCPTTLGSTACSLEVCA